jgi:4a-hydroxytetrahydrobiopterin dehydratase
MTVLAADEVQRRIQDLPGWQIDGAAIRKEYPCASFRSAIIFVNVVADVAELEEHHPDIMIQYNQVTMSLSTHSEGGVTERDIAMARRIEAAFASLS